MTKKCAYTEYAVGINNENGFVKQVDVLETYEEADFFAKHLDIPLKQDEYLNIIFIDYDEFGNEICFGSVV